MAIFPSDAHKASFLAKMKELGVDSMTVHFSGGGDSGAVDSVDFYNGKTHVPTKGVTMLWQREKTDFDEARKEWIRSTVDLDVKLEEIGELITYQALEECGLDWYNNDGGQGQFEITFNDDGEPEISLDVGINYTETEDYRFTFSGS